MGGLATFVFFPITGVVQQRCLRLRDAWNGHLLGFCHPLIFWLEKFLFVCFFPIYYSIRYNPPFHADTCRLRASKSTVGSFRKYPVCSPSPGPCASSTWSGSSRCPLGDRGLTSILQSRTRGPRGNSRDQGVMAAERGHQFDQGHSLAILIPRAG